MSDENCCKPSPRRGLLVHGGALGDYILTLRVVEAMRMAGLAAISVLGRRSAVGLGRCAGLEQVLDLEAGGFHLLFGPTAPPSDSRLRRILSGFELTINMLAAGATLSSERLRALTGGAVIGLDPRPQRGSRQHITEQWLTSLGVPPKSVAVPSLMITNEQRRDARRALGEKGAWDRRTALIHPGSGGRAKCWPVQSFAHLARRLLDREWNVIGLLGPVELETWIDTELEVFRASMPLICIDDLQALAAHLSAAELYIGNDSGVTHVSAAVATPTVAIFGPTDPCVWRPLGRQVRVVAGAAGQWPTIDEVFAACNSIRAA